MTEALTMIRHFLSTMVVLLAATSLRAADEPKPNTLTPKEIAEGWLLLFDGESTFGWTTKRDVKVVNHELSLVGDDKSAALLSTTDFGDFELRFQYRLQEQGGTGAILFWQRPPEKGPIPAGANVAVRLLRAASNEEKASDDWAEGTVRVAGDKVNFKVAHSGDRTRSEEGINLPTGKDFRRPAIYVQVSPKSHLFLRDLKLRPLGAKPVFNGKDLTGWKKFETDKKRAISDFSVNKDGHLTIKNGPGDLQSEGQWADFVLQIECKTNGPRLNSGVFFRCIPGDYQNGYEAQIHNGWTEKPEKEYTIEEYDPNTNEIKDKKKVKSTAMDYGTGAIYRRIPARKAVAKDKEWFTMTVVAEGRHIATWVDGVQVVDWTDNRPLKDNPRNGCRLEKGPISLQGHDPTTDLNFRNIRIAELPTTKK
jgi:hypothetical protein